MGNNAQSIPNTPQLFTAYCHTTWRSHLGNELTLAAAQSQRIDAQTKSENRV